MLYGVSYYPEYQPYDRLDTDVAMMVQAKINYVRLGDAIWSLCEPVEGQFEIDWLQRVLDTLDAAGIKIIFCTPTYAIPSWLHRRYPEVMATRADGSPTPYGGRQNVDITNPTYRSFAERMIRTLWQRYARHPGIIGFQVDNETGTAGAQNPALVDTFAEHIRQTYRSLDRVNETWGLTYWSHRLGEWADLWPPAGNTNPGYDLEWRRFLARQTTGFLQWQADIVRQYARDDQIIIQDVVGLHGRPDADRYAIGAAMDVVAENFPHATQDGLAHPRVHGLAMYPANTTGSGPAQLYQRSDMAYGAKRQNFFITEMNPISIAGSDNVFPCYDGQWRMAAFATISRGADMVAYWHWHSLHYGNEIYSHGVLNHDLEPNRNYREVAGIGADLETHGELLTGLRPDSDVAFLYSYDSRWAMMSQPPLKNRGGGADRGSYARIFDTCYRGFFDARAQAIVLPVAADISQYRVVVAPGLYCADDQTLQRLADYVAAGGHLVLTFRSGYADEYARARWVRAPGPLRTAAGVGYNLYSNLAKPLPVKAPRGPELVEGPQPDPTSQGPDPTSQGPELVEGPQPDPTEQPMDLPEDCQALGWMDELVIEDESTRVLAAYDHPHFGRFPAVTTHPYGKGRLTYIGTLPDERFARSIAGWVLRASAVSQPGTGLPEAVRITGATARDGRRLTFVANWSFDTHRLPAELLHGTDLFAGAPVDDQHPLELGPWDIRVIAAV